MSEQPPLLPEYESVDDRIIELAIDEAELHKSTISHAIARMIGSQFHGGQSSAFYAFASSGAIDLEPLVDEYCETYIDVKTTEPDKRKLRHLGRYVLEHGRRGPVAGWSELWSYE